MTATSTRTALAVLLVAVTVLAGCTGAGGGAMQGGDADGGAGGGDLAATRVAEATATPAMARQSGADGGAADPIRAERAVIRTGHVRLEVADFDAASRNLTAAARAHGGFVGDSGEELHRRDNETWTTGRLVLRVPAENYSALMERVKAEGTVLEASTDRQDVTEQLVDLEARLENLRAERDRLRRLYERANTTSEVLEVQERLSDVQGEIERIEARQQALERRVALSTIHVRLEEPPPEPSPLDPDRWYDTPIVAAFLESVNGVVVVLRAMVVGFAYALPYLLAIGVPIAAVAILVWRRRRGDAFP